MKSSSTIRRELKRLRGMRSRSGLDADQSSRLFRDICALEWVMGKDYLRRPSQRHSGIECRKGEP